MAILRLDGFHSLATVQTVHALLDGLDGFLRNEKE